MGWKRSAIRQLGRRARSLRRDKRGVAATELALIAPVLMAMLLGMSEAALYMNVHYRATGMATTVADVIARYQSVTASDVSALLDASSAVMGSTDFSTNGTVILSSVSKDKSTDSPLVAWQCKGGGSLAAVSKVGSVKGTATLPGNLALDAGDNVIIAEVFYRYSPVVSFVTSGSSTVYKTSIFRPRLGALTTAPGC